jgi:hypothetical protein
MPARIAAALAIIAVSLTACSGPWTLWTQTGPQPVEQDDTERVR